MARILLAEDYPDVRAFLCQAIEEAGHSPVCVATVGEARRELASGNYDLVIADVRMPDGSGYTLAEEAAGLGIKTIIITGHPDEMLLLDLRKVLHLRKPFRLNALMGLIR